MIHFICCIIVLSTKSIIKYVTFIDLDTCRKRWKLFSNNTYLGESHTPVTTRDGDAAKIHEADRLITTDKIDYLFYYVFYVVFILLLSVFFEYYV